jgi:DNA-directed RNA polymerase specialized sigma24 family protein
MPSDESVSQWLDQLREGDPAAARKLWERYSRRLVGLARLKLQGTPRRAADEEDVALSAFKSLCRGAEEGRFPDLADRDNLWRLLVTITARKAYQLRRYEDRRRPRGGVVLDQAAVAGPADSGSGVEPVLQQIADPEPPPDFVAQLAEEVRCRLAVLPTAELHTVAQRKPEGFTNAEIASHLGCALRAVERKLRVIRSVWRQPNKAPRKAPGG